MSWKSETKKKKKREKKSQRKDEVMKQKCSLRKNPEGNNKINK